MEPNNLQTYYMIQVEGKPASTMRHYSQQNTKAEAERLCEKEHLPVDVLQCIASYYPKQLRSTADMVDALLDTAGDNNVSKLDLADRLLNLQSLVEKAYGVIRIDHVYSEEAFQKDVEDTDAFLAEAERYIDN